MKWVFLTALVVVIGAVAAFGIYTWGWHDEGDDSPGEAEVRVYATELAALRDTRLRPNHRVEAVRHLGGDLNGRQVAALTTARSLEEISAHWDAVYEAMRRIDTGEEESARPASERLLRRLGRTEFLA